MHKEEVLFHPWAVWHHHNHPHKTVGNAKAITVTKHFGLHLQSILAVLKGRCVLLEGSRRWKEGWRYAITRHGGQSVAPTGISEMLLLSANTCTIHQTVS